MSKLRIFSVLSASLLMLAGCKTGTIKGKVVNPLTGKPVKTAIVQVLNTRITDTTGEDGTFELKEVDLGLDSTILRVGKHYWSKSRVAVPLSEEKISATQDLYIYPRKNPETKQKLNPGFFLANADSITKILNHWISYEAKCKDGTFAYSSIFVNQKNKKVTKLPEPSKQKSDAEFLYYQATSTSQAVVARAVPLTMKSVKNSKCEGFDKKEKKALFADIAQAKDLTVEYTSDGMYRIKGPFAKGKQAIQFLQKGKILASYYLDIQ